MDKIIIVFCEGDHDIAFLSRLLLVNSFSKYEKKIKEFIAPLRELYLNTLKNHKRYKNIEDSEFKFQGAIANVPYAVYEKDNMLVIFHNLTGDGNILNGQSTDIQKKYLKLNGDGKDDFSPNFNYRFLYFLDADNDGVDIRLNEIKKLLALEINTLEHHALIQKDDYEIGCCVFHDIQDVNKHGKLENILLDLMKSNNEDIFQNSLSFIEKNPLKDDRQRKFICTNKKEESKGLIQFKKEKSIISIAGQLQFSGSNNSVIIENSDYIKRDDILNSSVCQDIIKLFK